VAGSRRPDSPRAGRPTRLAALSLAARLGGSLVPGKDKVEVNWNKKTGRKMPTGDGDPVAETKEGLPAQFNSATTQTAVVKSGSQTIDFPLTSK